MAVGKSAGRVSVRVVPDSTQFRTDLEKILARAERQLRGTLRIDADTSKADEAIEKLRSRLNNDWTAKIHADINGKVARAQLAVLSRSRVVDIVAKINTKSLVAVGTALAALSGGRVLGDRLSSIGKYLGNLDRHVPKIAAVSLAIASVGAASLASLSGLVSLGAGLVAVGGAGLALPAIYSAAAISFGTMVLALKDAKTVLADLEPAFTKLQNSVSASFWAKAEKPIRRLIADTLPALTKNMSGTATQLGNITAEVSAGLRNAFSSGAIGGLFTNLNAGLAKAAGGVQPLISALTILGQVGSQYLPRMGAGFTDLAKRFDAFIQRTRASGDLQMWIDNGIAALGHLGRVISGTVGILSGLLKAAQAAGAGNGLEAFATTLQSISAVINSPTFQTALTTLFTGAGVAMEGLAAALKPLGNMIASLAPTLSFVMAVAGDAIGGFVTAIAAALSNPAFARGLTTFFQGIEKGLAAIGPALPAVAAALGSLGAVAGVLAATLGPVLAAAMKTLAPVVTQLATALTPLITLLGQALVAAITAIAPVLGPLIQALVSGFMPIVQALVPIISALVPFIAQMALIFAQLVPPVLAIVAALLTGLLPVFQQLMPVLLLVGQTLATVLLTAIQQLMPIVPVLASTIGTLLTALLPLVPSLLSVVTAMLPLLPVLAETVVAVLQVVAALAPLLAMLVKLQVNMNTMLMPAFKLLVAVISTSVKFTAGLLSALAAAFQGNFDKARQIVVDTMASIVATLDAATGGMVTNLIEGLARLIVASREKFTALVTTVRELPGRIKAALGNLGSLLYGAGRDVVQGMINGIAGMLGALASKAAEMARSALGAAKRALGINSPSRAFRDQVGRMLPAGVEDGIDDGQRSLNRRVNGMVRVPNLPHFAVSDGGRLAGGITVEQNNTITQPEDPRIIAAHLGRTLARALV